MQNKKVILLASFLFALFLGAWAYQNNQGLQTEDTYYFYEVDEEGEIDEQNPLNPVPLTLDQFGTPGICPAGENQDCIRAWKVGNTPSGMPDHVYRKL